MFRIAPIELLGGGQIVLMGNPNTMLYIPDTPLHIILCWHNADLLAGITVLLSTQQKYDKKLIEERDLKQGCGSAHFPLIAMELKYVFFVST